MMIDLFAHLLLSYLPENLLSSGLFSNFQQPASQPANQWRRILPPSVIIYLFWLSICVILPLSSSLCFSNLVCQPHHYNKQWPSSRLCVVLCPLVDLVLAHHDGDYHHHFLSYPIKGALQRPRSSSLIHQLCLCVFIWSSIRGRRRRTDAKHAKQIDLLYYYYCCCYFSARELIMLIRIMVLLWILISLQPSYSTVFAFKWPSWPSLYFSPLLFFFHPIPEASLNKKTGTISQVSVSCASLSLILVVILLSSYLH